MVGCAGPKELPVPWQIAREDQQLAIVWVLEQVACHVVTDLGIEKMLLQEMATNPIPICDFSINQTHDGQAPSPYPEVFMVLDLKSSWDFQIFWGGTNVGSPCWCVHIAKRSTGALEKRCERNVPHGVPVPRMDDTTQRGTCVTAKRAAANRTKAQRASKAIGTAPVDWWLRKEDNQQVTDPIKFVFRQVLPCVAKKKRGKKTGIQMDSGKYLH